MLFLAFSNNLLPQTQKEVEAEAAAVLAEEKLKNETEEKESNETKLCWQKCRVMKGPLNIVDKLNW